MSLIGLIINANARPGTTVNVFLHLILYVIVLIHEKSLSLYIIYLYLLLMDALSYENELMSECEQRA